MPPKSIGSAVALIGLSSLTAIEAGGCDKRAESLRSATRSGLPLVTLAAQAAVPEMNYALSDYGLRSRPDLKHVCGRYELRADGKLLTWDLFVTAREPLPLKSEIAEELKLSQKRASAASTASSVSVVVDSSGQFAWPRGCSKTLMANAHSVLVASRVL